MVGFRMAGSGIRVFVLGNMGLGWVGEKYKSMMGRVGCGKDWVWPSGVVYVVYWRCLKGAVIRLISCNAPLKASRLLWVYIFDGSLFQFYLTRFNKI